MHRFSMSKALAVGVLDHLWTLTQGLRFGDSKSSYHVWMGWFRGTRILPIFGIACNLKFLISVFWIFLAKKNSLLQIILQLSSLGAEICIHPGGTKTLLNSRDFQLSPRNAYIDTPNSHICNDLYIYISIYMYIHTFFPNHQFWNLSEISGCKPPLFCLGVTQVNPQKDRMNIRERSGCNWPLVHQFIRCLLLKCYKVI